MNHPSETRLQILRFLVVGGASVLIDCAVYAVLAGLDFPLPAAKGISYVAGMILGFILNKLWTFGSPRAFSGEVLSYAALYGLTLLVNIGVNSLVLSFGSTWQDGKPLATIAFLAATGITTVLNFLGMRFVTFRRGIVENRRREHHPSASVINESDHGAGA